MRIEGPITYEGIRSGYPTGATLEVGRIVAYADSPWAPNPDKRYWRASAA
jgi:hypothetical protein